MRQKITEVRLLEFMRRLGSGVTGSSRVFLVGGASAVLLGWWDSTVDIALKLIPESDEILRKIPALKEQL